MDDELLGSFFIAILIVVISFFVGYNLGVNEQRFEWQKVLIEKDIGEYNGTTGKWQWKEEYRSVEK